LCHGSVSLGRGWKTGVSEHLVHHHLTTFIIFPRVMKPDSNYTNMVPPELRYTCCNHFGMDDEGGEGNHIGNRGGDPGPASPRP
jgi:hypothetical protein